MNRHDTLIGEGWEKRFTAHGDRLEESVRLFRQLGYEVRLEPPEVPDNVPDSSCESCLLNEADRTIFVRPGKAGDNPQNEETEDL